MNRRELVRGAGALAVLSAFPLCSSSASSWTRESTGVAGTFLGGVNLHAGDWGQVPRLTNSTIYRDSIRWGYVEKQAGIYDWSDPRTVKVVKLANSLRPKISALIILGGAHPKHGGTAGMKGGLPLMANDIAAYSQYVDYVIQRLGGSVPFVEIWNEWNQGGNESSAEERSAKANTAEAYLALLSAAYRAVKNRDPSVKVIGGVMLDPYWPGTQPWVKRFLSGHPETVCDGISFHHYYDNEGTSPEIWFTQLQKSCAQIQSACGNIPLHLTETNWHKLPDAEIAKRWSRFPFLLRSLPLTTFQQFDAVSNAWGLMSDSGAAKPQLSTFKDALAHVNVATTASAFKNGKQWVVSLATPTGNRLALWDEGGASSVSVSMTASSGGTLSIQTIGGTTATKSLSPGTNSVSVPLTDTAVVLSADVAVSFPDPS
jgi:trimeric autotransporter adhesin